jgi:ligand-binding SRPBCC domain-containing protein
VLQFEYTSVIEAPVETLFAFHERPDALELLIPPGQPVRALERSGGIEKGARVVLGMPFGIRWVATHTDYKKNKLFIDFQESGPFFYWEHRHQFETLGPKRSRLTDSINFSLPPRGMLDFAIGWAVKLQLRAMFRYRHATTKKYCENVG